MQEFLEKTPDLYEEKEKVLDRQEIEDEKMVADMIARGEVN